MRLDSVQFDAAVRTHQDMVFSIAWHFLRDRHSAEDVAQEVFFELHRHLDAIESDAHMTNWLRRVASRRCIDRTRRLRLRPRVGLESASEPSVPAQPGDPFLRDHLQRLLDGLPARSRMAVILRFQEDMELTEVASAMGIPVGSVKSTLHRALRFLREKLERTANGVVR